MKKCPYCAEQIQDEAIVCRYCGRDLPITVKKSEDTVSSTQIEAKPSNSSIWVQGAKASAVFTALYILNQFIEPQTTSNLVFRLTIGLMVTFIGFWLICSGIVWLWRQFRIGGLIALVVAIGILVIIAISRDQNNNIATPLVEATSIKPTLIITPIPTEPPPALLGERVKLSAYITDVSNCELWTNIKLADEGKEKCVYGIIRDLKERFNSLLHPEPFLLNEPCPNSVLGFTCGLHIGFSTRANTIYNDDDFFVETNMVYDVKITDCIIVIGPVEFINADKNVRSISTTEKLSACPPGIP